MDDLLCNWVGVDGALIHATCSTAITIWHTHADLGRGGEATGCTFF